jgi:ABC-type transport system involved in multi-copper enzyme maturation permease subunit
LTGKLRELIAWELQENWAFPILELILAISIIQILPIVSLYRGYRDVSLPFWPAMTFVFSISAAIIFGRSFAESVEKRKLIVLLSYPVSRVQVFAAKFLANFISTLLVFGAVLLIEGMSLFMFAPGTDTIVGGAKDMGLAPTIWGLMFLSLFLVVFFTSSLMTIVALAIKRLGLSILVFLTYIFGVQYWVTSGGNYKALQAALSLNTGPRAIVRYLTGWYYNTLGVGITNTEYTTQFFAVALGYLLGGGLVCLIISLIIIRRIDLD